MSVSRSLFHTFIGRLLPLQPCSVHCSVYLAILLSFLLNVYPSLFCFLILRWFGTGSFLPQFFIGHSRQAVFTYNPL